MWAKSGRASWRKRQKLKRGEKFGDYTGKKMRRNTEGERCGFRGRAISPFVICYFQFAVNLETSYAGC